MMLLESIKAGIRNSTQVCWPGTTESIRLRVLSKQEMQLALFSAERRFSSEKCAVALHTLAAYEEERTIQILFMALSSLDGKERLAANVDSFRALITTDDVDELSRLYNEFESETSPNLEGGSDEEIEALIRDIKKKPDEVLGSVSSIALARRLLRSLVSQLPT